MSFTPFLSSQAVSDRALVTRALETNRIPSRGWIRTRSTRPLRLCAATNAGRILPCPRLQTGRGQYQMGEIGSDERRPHQAVPEISAGIVLLKWL
jgi:hypothetical protein